MNRRTLGRFTRNRSAVVGASLVGAIVLFAIVGPMLSSQDPLISDFAGGIEPGTGLPARPSSRHLLGADPLFRDELARLAAGARLSLVIGLASTIIATAIGTVVGIVAGWFQGERGPRVPAISLAVLLGAIVALVYGRGRVAALLAIAAVTIYVIALVKPRPVLSRGWHIDVDSVLMRTVDIGLSFPFLLLVMAIGAALEKTSVGTILLVLGFTGWLGTARIVRARTMQLRRLEFIDAARALGQRTPRVLLSHVLPNVAGPIVVIATAQVAQMIIAESVLAYLGVGVSPPTPTWGGMLSQGQDFIAIAPRLVLAPAIAILVTVLGFNLMGEGLRDALDPRDVGRLQPAAEAAEPAA